jgi:hypothetical protein
MDVKIVKRPLKDFKPDRGFDSPSEAAEYCAEFPEPEKRAMEIVQANIDMGEYGFASELVAEMETLPSQAEELLVAKNAAIQDLQNAKGKKKQDKLQIHELGRQAAVAELKYAIQLIYGANTPEDLKYIAINLSSANSLLEEMAKNLN